MAQPAKQEAVDQKINNSDVEAQPSKKEAADQKIDNSDVEAIFVE